MSPEEMMECFKENGWIMIPQPFMQTVIDAIHQNISVVKMMAEIEELQGGALTPNMQLLSKRLSEVAFTLEGVMYDQQ